MSKTALLPALAVGLTLCAGSGVAATATPAQQGTVEQRLERLERLMNSQALVDMLSRLDALQNDLQQLRGQAEEQNHALAELKQRQRDLYLDIDRRLSRLEREDPGMAAENPGPDSGSAVAGGSTPAVAGPGSGMQTTTGASSQAPATSSNMTAGRSPAAGASAESVAQERQAYQKAFDLLRQLRYEPAVEAFQGFLKQYPDGRYAQIAQYWLGEANYARRDFKAAIADYGKLLERYPHSPKVAEAMLKIGYSYYSLGQTQQAQQTLSELIRAHPDTTEAGQAQKLLETIKRERR